MITKQPTPLGRWLGPLLLGGLLLTVSNGRWIWPLVTWLAPVPWLLFARRAPRRALPIGLLVSFLVQTLTWHGLIPAPGLIYLAIVALYATAYFLPLLIDRVLSPSFAGPGGTLVYPAAAVAVEFLFQRYVTPYGSWFSPAYTQTGNLPLLQAASLAGTTGFSWMIAWGGSVAAARWEHRAAAWRAELGFAGVLGALLVFGLVRLRGRAETGAEVRVAGLVADRGLAQEVNRRFALVPPVGPTTGPAWDALRLAAEDLNADLLRRTEREAAAGAELVSWSETAGRVLKPDEPDLLARAGRLARERLVYLAVAYGTFSPGAARPLENRVALLDTTGTVAFITDKVHPIVGPESPMVAPGDRRLRFLDTPFGRLGVVVCHDLDFPELLRQAGAVRAALVIGPSDDWTAILSMHANMALVRAVEQGFTLFRPTAGGRSLAVTPRGRTLAAVDAPRDAFVAILRPAGRRTLYAATGDLFAWGCVVGMVGAALLTVAGRVRRET